MAKGPPAPELLLELIRDHGGSLSAIANSLTAAGTQVSRQTVTNWIKRAGLEQKAAEQRALNGLPGPRPLLEAGSVDAGAERAAIVASATKLGSLKAAGEQLGLSRRALYRRRKALGLATARAPAKRPA